MRWPPLLVQPVCCWRAVPEAATPQLPVSTSAVKPPYPDLLVPDTTARRDDDAADPAVRGTGKMTRPGTRLRFGQKAIVPIRDYNALRKCYTEGAPGIVVQRIRQTAAPESRATSTPPAGPCSRRSTAYHAEILITDESRNAMSLPVPRIEARRSGGGVTDVSLLGGTLPGCTESPSPGLVRPQGRSMGHLPSSGCRPTRFERSTTWPCRTARTHSPPTTGRPTFNQYYDRGEIIWH